MSTSTVVTISENKIFMATLMQQYLFSLMLKGAPNERKMPGHRLVSYLAGEPCFMEQIPRSLILTLNSWRNGNHH